MTSLSHSAIRAVLLVFTSGILWPQTAKGAQLFRFGCYSNADSITVTSVSADGRVIVGHNSKRDIVRWTPSEGLTVVGKPTGFPFAAHVTGISADGEEIVGYAQSSESLPVFRSFTWSRSTGFLVGHDKATPAKTNGVFTPPRVNQIRLLPGYEKVIVRGESQNGDTVVGSFGRAVANTYEEIGFAWTERTGTTVLQDDNGVVFRNAFAVNADSTVIVGSATFPDLGMKAGIWRRNTPIQSLEAHLREQGVDLGRLVLYSAIDVSDDGNVVVAIGSEGDCTYETCVAYLGTRVDADRDSLPDEWESAYFGNDRAGPDEDPDGDGVTNLREYEGGSNPTVTDAEPYVIDMQCGSTACIRIRTSKNWLYTLQYCDDLGQSNWRDVGGQQRIAGVDGTVTLTDGNSVDRGFYRVVAEINKPE